MKKVMFVSGHMDLTPEEFQAHYAPKLRLAVTQDNCTMFAVGDAPGADLMAQDWLYDENELRASQERPLLEVMVFHMLERPRNCLSSDFKQVGGFKSDEERDAGMTYATSDDIAWVRPTSRRNSGTEKNIKRRQEIREKARAIEIATWPRVSIHERELWPVYEVSLNTEANVRAISDVIAMDDDGQPVILDDGLPILRLPEKLIERWRNAALEFYTVQAEIQQLLFEQDYDK